MSKFSIIGAGKAGLVLGIGLRQLGHEVTIYTLSQPEELRGGRITSNQCIFQPTLEIEQELGINFWEDEIPPIKGLQVKIGTNGESISFEPTLHGSAGSVDQRMKFARWLEHFETIGGQLKYTKVEKEDIPDLSESSDLVFVATGRGALGRMFDVAEEKNEFSQPQRELKLLYVRGLDQSIFRPDRVNIQVLPGIGEMFAIPLITLTRGIAWGVNIEAVPGGPLDTIDDMEIINRPEEFLDHCLGLINEYMPYYAQGITDDTEITDDLAVLAGSYPPTIREPYIELDDDTVAIGVGDAVVLNDPIAGQGANTATHHAWHLIKAVQEHDNAFDVNFARQTFDDHWGYAKDVTKFSNALLQPVPDHAMEFFELCQDDNRLGHLFAEGFAHPSSLEPWFYDPESMDHLLRATGYRID